MKVRNLENLMLNITILTILSPNLVKIGLLTVSLLDIILSFERGPVN